VFKRERRDHTKWWILWTIDWMLTSLEMFLVLSYSRYVCFPCRGKICG